MALNMRVRLDAYIGDQLLSLEGREAARITQMLRMALRRKSAVNHLKSGDRWNVLRPPRSSTSRVVIIDDEKIEAELQDAAEAADAKVGEVVYTLLELQARFMTRKTGGAGVAGRKAEPDALSKLVLAEAMAAHSDSATTQ